LDEPAGVPPFDLTAGVAAQATGAGTVADDQPLDAIVIEPVPGPGFWASAGLCVLLMMFQFTAIAAVSIPAFVLGFRLDESITLLFLTSTASICAIAVGAVLLWYGTAVVRKMALRFPSLWQTVLVILLVAPAQFVVQELSALASYVLPTFGSEQLVEFASQPWPLVLLIGCVLPGVGEEIFFRGLLGRGLVARFGPWIGILLTAVLFGLVHIDPVQAVGVIAIGAILQLVYLATRSIIAPMLLHTINNALAFAMARAEFLLEADHVPAPLLATSMLAIIPLAMLLYTSRSRWITAEGEQWSPGYVTAESPPESAAAHLKNGRPALLWLLCLPIAYGLFLWAMYMLAGSAS